ncbi:MAG: hypothetical protein N2510_06170 [Ignavibacteria bacterium]|nr:hypothetical protein [Ignavibacteria bacterium]
MELNNNNKVAKGYRLRVSTHRLIKDLVNYTGSDYDTIISNACMLLEKEIKYISGEYIFKKNSVAESSHTSLK